MAIVRIIKDKNFITMGKYHLQEKDMSLKAKGLLSQMLSLPDNWDYSIKGLTSINKESYDNIRNILNELEEFGYLHRVQIKDAKGKFIEVEYTVYEKPIRSQDIEKPITEKPITGNPLTENQGQLNNKLIKEINNKKEIYKEKNKAMIEATINYLNKKTGKAYRPTTPNTIKHLTARINEGYNDWDFMDVIDTKCKEWMGTDMEKYLRPETLFGSKFENYLNQ